MYCNVCTVSEVFPTLLWRYRKRLSYRMIQERETDQAEVNCGVNRKLHRGHHGVIQRSVSRMFYGSSGPRCVVGRMVRNHIGDRLYFFHFNVFVSGEL